LIRCIHGRVNICLATPGSLDEDLAIDWRNIVEVFTIRRLDKRSVDEVTVLGWKV